MSATTTHTTETTAERKPPTIADIVREKTGDGALIIDFFTDVMTGRIEGAELCHRIDAAKQLVKYGSKDAAEFLAKYKGVPCGHSINGRPDPADPCSAADRSLVAVTLNAPPTLTRDFLTVLSGIDEFLMARLIRAQTADGVTVIEFLDDVMQDRTDGFKTHHRIAAAKELIVHIVRDEQPSHTPSTSPLTGEGWGEGDTPAVGADPRVRPLPGSQTPSPLTGEGWGEGDTPAVGADPRVRPLPGSQTPSPLTGEGWGEGDSSVVPAQAEGNPDNTIVVPAKAGTQGSGVARPSKAGVHPEPNSSVVPAQAEGNPDNSIVVPAKAGTQGCGVARPSKAGVHPEPNSSVVPAQAEGNPDNSPVVPAEAGTQGGGVARPSKAGIHREPSSSVVPAPTAVVPAKSLPRTRYGAGTHPRDPEPGSQLETKNSKLKTLPTRRDGATRAATRRKALGSERIEEEKDEKPAPAELTIAERRIKERLEQHWHEPDPWAGPIDSASPGRSPPW